MLYNGGGIIGGEGSGCRGVGKAFAVDSVHGESGGSEWNGFLNTAVVGVQGGSSEGVISSGLKRRG